METEKDTFLAIDLNLDNLAACVDHLGRSFILDGRLLKSYNRWYNKRRAKLQSIKDKQEIEEETERMYQLRKKRENKNHDYLNKAVAGLVDYCVEHKIEKVFCGDGRGWKQKIDLGGEVTPQQSRGASHGGTSPLLLEASRLPSRTNYRFGARPLWVATAHRGFHLLLGSFTLPDTSHLNSSKEAS